MAQRSLDDLLKRFLERNDASAMEEIVRQTRSRLLGVARRIGAPQDADDSVQAAYHSLLARKDDWDGAPAMAWLVTAVVRVSYRRKAKAQRQMELARRLDRPRSGTTPLAHLAREETSQAVQRAVVALPSGYRDVVALHHLEGLTTTEVAALLGVPKSTVTTRLRRARRLLRHRLSARLIYGALLVPWLIADAAKTVAPVISSIGVFVQAKSIATIVAIGLTSGAIGFCFANVTDVGGQRSGRAGADDRIVHALKLQLQEAQEQVRVLRKNTSRPDLDSNGSKPIRKAPEPEKPRRYSRVTNAGVVDAAMRLGVVEAAMNAAIDAERAFAGNKDGRYERLDELKRFGEQGFRAALAIVRGASGAGGAQGRLLRETYLPGLEGLILEALDSDDVRADAKGVAIRALVKADTPAVREYLVQRINREKHRGLFWSLTLTLGALKEPRAASAVGRKLLFDEPARDADWRPLRSGMLWQLCQMGGEDAHAILEEYIRDERVTRSEDILQGLNCMAVLDKPLCGELAHQVMQEPRGKTISGMHRKRMDIYLRLREK